MKISHGAFDMSEIHLCQSKIRNISFKIFQTELELDLAQLAGHNSGKISVNVFLHVDTLVPFCNSFILQQSLMQCTGA